MKLLQYYKSKSLSWAAWECFPYCLPPKTFYQRLEYLALGLFKQPYWNVTRVETYWIIPSVSLLWQS